MINQHEKVKRNRKRGKILTPRGMEKLCNALENKKLRYEATAIVEFLERNADHCEVLSDKIISKILNRTAGVDQKSLIALFRAFNIELLDEDYKYFFREKGGDFEVKENSISTHTDDNTQLDYSKPPLPGMPLAVDELFYIRQLNLEEECFQEISCPGSLIRVKGALRRGKSSLANCLYDLCINNSFSTAMLSLREDIDKNTLTDLNGLLKWFCIGISREIGITPRIEQYWDSPTPMLNCGDYFEDYLLGETKSPIVIILDDVDALFNLPSVCQEFLSLIRGFYQKANRKLIWRKLRIVVLHSTLPYLKIDINESPFNVGKPFDLNHFTSQDIRTLARKYNLQENENESISHLWKIIGNEPYLIQKALYSYKILGISIQDIIQLSHTPQGIYRDHLRQIEECINTSHPCNYDSELHIADSLKMLISRNGATHLPTSHLRRLTGLGIISQDNSGKAFLSCELYRRYFNETYQ